MGLPSPEELNEVAAQYEGLRAPPEIYFEIGRRIPEITGGVRDWFVSALRADKARRFAAGLLEYVKPGAPITLARELLHATMLDDGLSGGRSLVLPLSPCLTQSAAYHLVLKIVEEEPDLIRGVGAAAYWVEMLLEPTADRSAYIAVNSRRMKVFHEHEEDTATLRGLIAGLSFASDDLDVDARGVAAAVIQKARTHPDDYIRHRVEVQLHQLRAGRRE